MKLNAGLNWSLGHHLITQIFLYRTYCHDRSIRFPDARPLFRVMDESMAGQPRASRSTAAIGREKGDESHNRQPTADESALGRGLLLDHYPNSMV